MFTTSQFGFRANKNTSQAVLNLITNIVRGIEAKENVLCRFYDMTKAFDTVAHKKLLEKLMYYKFDNLSLKLVESYLNNRYQCVFYNGTFSEYLPVKHGVP